MKSTTKRLFPILLAVVFAASIIACGGGGEVATDGSDLAAPSTPISGTSSPVSGLTMRWAAPESYSDQTQLDPEKDLDSYEIYVNQTGTFSETEEPAAVVFATEANGNPLESFSLENLVFSFSTNQTYYFCMRSITKAGVASEFSSVVRLTI